MNTERVIQRMVNFRRKSFIQVLNRTMIALFPLVLIGCFSWLTYDNFLSPDGFLGSVLHVNAWLPFRRFFQALFADVTQLSVGWLAPLGSIVSGIVTTKYYHHETPMAGVAAIVCYTTIFIHSVRGNNQALETRYYTAAWFLIGVIVGYLVGRLFVKYGQPAKFMDLRESNQAVVDSVLHNLKPMAITMGIAFLVHLLYALYRQFGLDGMVSQWIASLLSRNSNYLLNIFLSLVNTVLSWLGFAEPLTAISQVYSNETAANLGYALSHKTAWGIPYPFTPLSLYYGFATFGGVGLTLALTIAILWISKNENQRKISRWSLTPGIFNIGLPILLGEQVFLNPVYLIPFVILPIINIVIASGVIFLHIIPPLVYPIPNGTPGILIPFMATGSNWGALVFTLLLLIMDVILYIPFVKLAVKVETRYQAETQEAKQDEKDD